jgi:hypothetical protein
VVIAKKDAEEKAKAEEANRKYWEARAQQSAKMAAAWKAPYTGGKIFCENEIWEYNADGSATSSVATFAFNGETITGKSKSNGTIKGEGFWDGTRIAWNT